MSTPISRTDFWRDYFSRQISDQSLSDTRKLDFSNDRVRFQTYSWLLESMGPLQGLSCLDVGCGTGDLSRLMHSLGARVDAFDLAEPAIAGLKRRHPDIRWFVADATNLSASGTGSGYDRVVASEVLQHVDAPTTLRALWDRVAQGGRMVAVMPNADCPIVQRAQNRFEGHYAGIDLPTLIGTLSGLPELALFRWRAAFFLEDQRLVPYGLGPWLDRGFDFGEAQPNRLQFVAVKAGRPE